MRPPAHAPAPGRPLRPRPPRERSLTGPLVFVLLVLVLVVGAVGAARPIVVDAVVDLAAERDTLLR
ncbi:MAG: hypothetical protein AAB114_02445, partial [Chloroflexota bacterium]